jgi:hypothetical protein
LPRNRIVKSPTILIGAQEVARMLYKSIKSISGRSVVSSALHAQAAYMPRRSASRGLLAARRTERRDRLIASALLLALLAGWALNFVSVKQLSLNLGDFLAQAIARHA